MNEVLKPFLGQKVEVYTGPRDEGILVAYDRQWIQIEKSDGEMLFFPIVGIRLVKLLKH